MPVGPKGAVPRQLGVDRAVLHEENVDLTMLRQEHEIRILQLTQEVRFLQWKQAQEATDALQRSRGLALERYRYYQRDTVHRLNFIQRAKLLGLTLDEVRDLITATDDARCDLLTPELREVVAHKLAECDRRLDELRRMRATLAAVAERLARQQPRATAADCAVTSAYAPECPCLPDVSALALDIPLNGKL